MKLVSTFLAVALGTICSASYALPTNPLQRFIKLPVAADINGSAHLRAELNRLITNIDMNADIAVYVKSMRNGETLYARNIHQALTPASTLKMITAEAALVYLGKDYRFNTQLMTDGQSIKNGVLQGNLYVVLSGDPSLTYPDLAELIDTLKQQEIYAIAGNVYIDNTAYDEQVYGPGWDDKDKSYCYAAPISASIIDRNCLSFKVLPAKTVGTNAMVAKSTKYFYPSIHNNVVTKARRSRSCGLRLTTTPGSLLSIEGCIPSGRYAWGVSYVVTDVPDYTRNLFKDLLRKNGLRVYGAVTFGKANKSFSIVANHESKPLRLIVNEMLKKSDNVIASSLFKKLGQIYTHQPGSWKNANYAISNILARQLHMNTRNLHVLDGSGLSTQNAATPAQMMQVLDFAYHHYATSYEFISALPIAGVDGTLKNRMKHIARRVRAKTGTISGVVSLAGYAVSAEQEPLAFVIMINGSKGMNWVYRTLEDKIATALTNYHHG